MFVQYKPDLKEAKTIPFNAAVLNMEPSASPIVCGLLWLSNAQFLVAFTDGNNTRSCTLLYILNSVKSGPPVFINYGEVCNEPSQDRPKRYISFASENCESNCGLIGLDFFSADTSPRTSGRGTSFWHVRPTRRK